MKREPGIGIAVALILGFSTIRSEPATAAWAPNGVVVCQAIDTQDDPKIVPDGAGGAIIAWNDRRQRPNTDIYAQRLTAAGEIGLGWPADGVVLYTPSRYADPISMVSDGAGGAIVAWADLRSGSWDIYAQRVTAGGAIASGWPADGRALCIAAGNQNEPAIVSDGAGGAIVAWGDGRNGWYSDIYAQRVTAAGAIAPGWPADGRALCIAAGNQYYPPAIVLDGAGGAIVAWRDGRNGNDYDIYAQRVTAAGAIASGWPADGRALSAAIGNYPVSTVVSDGAGGAIVGLINPGDWPYNEIDIYAQRITAAGAIASGWPADGVVLCTTQGVAYMLAMAVDGAGGAIAAWYDDRNGGSNIYAQRVTAAGDIAPDWPSNGAALCTANGIQASPDIVSDGAGGAIVAWWDFRGSDSDIYAQRLGPDGRIPTAAELPGLTAALTPGWPNPFRHEVRIGFTLPAAAPVSAAVFDAAGRLVRELLRGTVPPGAHALVWDGRGGDGVPRPAGIYFVQLRSPGFEAQRKVVRLP